MVKRTLTWKGYRGGTAPEIWVGEFASGRFNNLTKNDANDLFPMWIRNRVFFLSDRSGMPNIWSMSVTGVDITQHTSFVAKPDDPTHIDGYDIRWPSVDADAARDRIVFVQGSVISVLTSPRDRCIGSMLFWPAIERSSGRGSLKTAAMFPSSHCPQMERGYWSVFAAS